MWVENRFALAFGVLYLVAGMACLIGSAERLANDSAPPQAGARVQGQIVARYQAVSAEGAHVPYVDYRFALPDRPLIEVSQPVARGAWLQLPPGMPVEIAYEPRDPGRSAVLSGVREPRGTLVFVFVAGACFVLTGMALIAEAVGWAPAAQKHHSLGIPAH